MIIIKAIKIIIIITSSHDNLAKRSFLDSIRIMIEGDPLYGFSQRETKEFAARTVLRPLCSTASLKLNVTTTST